MHVLKRWVTWLRKKRWVMWLRNHRRAVSLAAAAIIGGLLIAYALIVPATDWLAAHDVGQVAAKVRAARLQTARDAARGRLLTLGAGVLAAGALVYTARNFALSRQGQVTDRYTKAIDQLGSDKGVDVRIGGIYALERIARDSSRDHPTIMEVLAAYIRGHPQQTPAEPSAEDLEPLAPDLQAAATVIGRRSIRYDSQPINLRLATLTVAILNYTNFSGAEFTGTNLSYATFYKANLSGAWFGGADLSRAHLGRANLAGAHLSYAKLTDADLTEADLTGADVTEADLTGANLTGARWPVDAEIPEGWQRDPVDLPCLTRIGDLLIPLPPQVQ